MSKTKSPPPPPKIYLSLKRYTHPSYTGRVTMWVMRRTTTTHHCLMSGTMDEEEAQAIAASMGMEFAEVTEVAAKYADDWPIKPGVHQREMF